MSVSRARHATIVASVLMWGPFARNSSAQEPSPAPSPTSLSEQIDALDLQQVRKALDILRKDHVRAAQVDDTVLDRATLRGLLDHLAPGAEFSAGAASSSGVSPFRSEILDGRAGYIRIGSLQAQNVARLDDVLREFVQKKVHGVVLDLRATPDSGDYELAAQVAGRFCPSGTALFKLSRPSDGTAREFSAKGDPLYRGVLVVIIDENTSGAAEALAATLRWHARALLVGARSSGRCVEFGSFPLGGGRDLRVAVAEIRVADQAVYPRGLRPDIEVAQEPGVREAILSAALQKGMGGFVFEQERSRLNEAALVAGTNPEIGQEESEAGLYDRPLQRAVDLVTAIRFFRRSD